MANNEKPNASATPESVGTYLKPGWSHGAVEVVIDNRPGSKTSTVNGPCLGTFGNKYDIPVSPGGRRAIVSVAVKSPDFEALKVAFGPVGPGWVGCVIRIEEDPIWNQLNVKPVRKAGA